MIARLGLQLGALCVAAGSVAAVVGAPPQDKPDQLPLDMSVWNRRDYQRCDAYGRVTVGGNRLTLMVDGSALKYWQIPTLAGPYPINDSWGWIRRCERPPASFAFGARQQAEEAGTIIRLADYPYVTWRWRVDGTIEDQQLVDAQGKVVRDHDDFAARFGVQMLPAGGEDLREVAYVWTHSIPVGTTLTDEFGVMFWMFTSYRVVVESGNEHVGVWRSVTRNLEEDYRRLWPDEEPGDLLRIFLMTDGDQTDAAITASYADIVLHRQMPPPADNGS